jgi:hypothetical protein
MCENEFGVQTFMFAQLPNSLVKLKLYIPLRESNYKKGKGR